MLSAKLYPWPRTRFNLRSAVASALVSLGLSPELVAQPTTTPTSRPHVVMIAIDDLNDWAGPLGGHPQGGTATPHLNELARTSVTFTNAHCAAPSCNPSRSSLMTGLRPSTTGIYFNGKAQHMETLLPKNRNTLPKHFKRHGYHTVGVGKLFHTAQAHQPEDWDVFHRGQGEPKPPGAPLGTAAHNNFDYGVYEPGRTLDQTMDGQTASAGLRSLLEYQGDTPLFLGVGIYRPHLPWYAFAADYDRFPLTGIRLPLTPPDGPLSDLDDIPPFGRVMAVTLSNTGVQRPGDHLRGITGYDHQRITAEDEWRAAVRAYLASIAFADRMAGSVLQALRERDEHGEYVNAVNWGNTIVVVWSDHGWHLGEKTAWRKFTLWEDVTRVPMWWHVPGVTEPGTSCNAPVSLIDVFPTLIEVAALPEVQSTGIEGAQRLEGRSLHPLLADVNTPWPHVAITENGPGHTAVRGARYRYIRYADGSEELYDHELDPHEWRNRADDPTYATHRERLARQIPTLK
ncbi:sulfatase [Mucisphaera calidilacus]|uniref:Choline-sulfatase n=1 Tax=Mucisphaera calidilacus TaxID=2527982 RepID=A0A518BWY9_9BACT|nr:sulfatase [Mucisphaera calidilacus]QDU71485.1 Choline-sulfatase [Mucisphaera calidilacus]